MTDRTTRVTGRIAGCAEGSATGYPYTVHGVAHGADEVTLGVHGPKFWPAEEVRKAAASLEGQTVWAIHEEDEGEAGVDEERRKVGKVTDAAFQPDLGVVYQAGLTDEEIARDLSTGDREVSIEASNPAEVEEHDSGAMVFRDYEYTGLATPRDGASPGTYTAPGGASSNPAIAALSASDIEAALNAYETKAGVRFRGTRDGKLDESEIPEDDVDDHYLFPDNESYPVVDADGYLRRGNVAAAYSVGPRGEGVTRDALYSKLRPLNAVFDTPPVQPSKMESGEDAAASAQFADLDGVDAEAVASAALSMTDSCDDPVSPEAGQGELAVRTDATTDAADSTMTDGNTEGAEALLSRIEQKDDRISELEDDLSETQATLSEKDSQLEDAKASLETARDEVREVKETYAAALADGGPFDEEELVENFDIAELREKVEDSDASLVGGDRQPDVQTGGGSGGDNGGDDDDLGLDGVDDETANARKSALRGMGLDEKASEVEAALSDN